MAFRKGRSSKRIRTRKAGNAKRGTRKRRLRGGISANLQEKIKGYNLNCRKKSWTTGKWVDKTDAKCSEWKASLEEDYLKERPDREQIAEDYKVDNPDEINDAITKPTKSWGLF